MGSGSHRHLGGHRSSDARLLARLRQVGGGQRNPTHAAWSPGDGQATQPSRVVPQGGPDELVEVFVLYITEVVTDAQDAFLLLGHIFQRRRVLVKDAVLPSLICRQRFAFSQRRGVRQLAHHQDAACRSLTSLSISSDHQRCLRVSLPYLG